MYIVSPNLMNHADDEQMSEIRLTVVIKLVVSSMPNHMARLIFLCF